MKIKRLPIPPLPQSRTLPTSTLLQQCQMISLFSIYRVLSIKMFEHSTGFEPVNIWFAINSLSSRATVLITIYSVFQSSETLILILAIDMYQQKP